MVRGLGLEKGNYPLGLHLVAHVPQWAFGGLPEDCHCPRPRGVASVPPLGRVEAERA